MVTTIYSLWVNFFIIWLKITTFWRNAVCKMYFQICVQLLAIIFCMSLNVHTAAKNHSGAVFIGPSCNETKYVSFFFKSTISFVHNLSKCLPNFNSFDHSKFVLTFIILYFHFYFNSRDNVSRVNMEEHIWKKTTRHDLH